MRDGSKYEEERLLVLLSCERLLLRFLLPALFTFNILFGHEITRKFTLARIHLIETF
jgi:hypothetical protein